MADDELSRSSAGDDDFEEPEDDNGIDNEGTLDEEEALNDADYDDELKGLEEEGEMSIEELRRRYGMPLESTSDNIVIEENSNQQPESSSLRNDYELLNEEDDTEDDKDYIPSDPYRKEIRIDEDLYQAQIPVIGETEMPHPVSEPLWMPTDNLSDVALNEYLQSIINIRKEIGQMVDDRYSLGRDDEDSLCALLRADYDINKAKASFPFPQVNKAIRSVRAEALKWDDQEKKYFEEAITTYGKNFSMIKSNSPLFYRTIGELVDYYYKWKTTDSYKAYRKRQQQSEEDYRQFANSIVTEHPPDGKADSSWLQQGSVPPV